MPGPPQMTFFIAGLELAGEWVHRESSLNPGLTSQGPDKSWQFGLGLGFKTKWLGRCVLGRGISSFRRLA